MNCDAHAQHQRLEEKASTHHTLGLHSMEELLLQGIANDRVLALHHKAVAGSPNKLQVSAPAHAKLLEGADLALADRQHPKVAFLHWHHFLLGQLHIAKRANRDISSLMHRPQCCFLSVLLHVLFSSMMWLQLAWQMASSNHSADRTSFTTYKVVGTSRQFCRFGVGWKFCTSKNARSMALQVAARMRACMDIHEEMKRYLTACMHACMHTLWESTEV